MILAGDDPARRLLLRIHRAGKSPASPAQGTEAQNEFLAECKEGE
jgi:hypothetical protein